MNKKEAFLTQWFCTFMGMTETRVVRLKTKDHELFMITNDFSSFKTKVIYALVYIGINIRFYTESSFIEGSHYTHERDRIKISVGWFHFDAPISKWIDPIAIDIARYNAKEAITR